MAVKKKPAPRRKAPKRKQVGTLTHSKASRRNIPTGEMQTQAERAEISLAGKWQQYLCSGVWKQGKTVFVDRVSH